MAFQTFIPPVGASFSTGTSESREPRVLAAQFGDGYTQRAGDGINANPGELSPSWNVLLEGEAQAILNFFASHKGYIPFKFKLPGEATARKWICTKWNRTWATNRTVDVTATWKEVFDPD